MARAPLFRFFSRMGEKLFGKETVLSDSMDLIESKIHQFAKQFPFATRREWMMFARELADIAYRDGFRAGYEWNEHELDRLQVEPEAIADRVTPDWRDIPYDMNAPIPATYDENGHVRDAFFRYTGREIGRRL